MNKTKDISPTMHELSLWGQVSQTREDQMLQILAGIAAMPPIPALERHIIFEPVRDEASRQKNSGPLGGSQEIVDQQKAARKAGAEKELFYLQIEESWADKGDDEEMGDESTSESMKIVRFDLPETGGQRPVTSRRVVVTPLESLEERITMDGQQYKFRQAMLLAGYRYVHNNVILHMYRIMLLPMALAQEISISEEQRPRLDACTMLDGSGAFILHASVMVEDGNNLELMARGTKELTQLRDLLKGCVELRSADRLALDTRLK